MKYGKWIGGALGWALGGPIGGALGFFMGMMFDDNSMAVDSPGSSDSQRAHQRQRTQRGDFAASLIVMSAAVMKADDRVLKSELDFVKRFFIKNFGERIAEHHILALRDVLKQKIPVREVCQQIRFNMEHHNRLLLLQYLFGIAYSDGEFHDRELQLLHDMSRWMGISAKDFASIRAMFGSGGQRTRSQARPISDAYKILEIEPSVSDQEVKKAYRRMANKYHPDKTRDLGEEYQKMAQDRFIQVQEAYEQVKNARGIK